MFRWLETASARLEIKVHYQCSCNQPDVSGSRTIAAAAPKTTQNENARNTITAKVIRMPTLKVAGQRRSTSRSQMLCKPFCSGTGHYVKSEQLFQCDPNFNEAIRAVGGLY